MNDIATNPQNTGLAIANLRAGLEQVRRRIAEPRDMPYLRMLTDGDWVFGQENNPVRPSDELAVNVLTIKQGFTCWTNRTGKAKNECKGDEMVPIGAPPIDVNGLPKLHDDDSGPNPLSWRPQFSVEMKFLDTEDASSPGTQVLWKNSSVGGQTAFAKLIDAVMARLSQGSDFIFPVVRLSSDHYQHKAHGRTYTPVVEIVEWMDGDGNFEDEDEADVPAGAAPTPAPAPAPAPTATAAPDAAEPVRRRRAR